MNQECISGLMHTWKNICENFTADELEYTLKFVEKNVDAFVIAFYEQMMKDLESAEYFSNELIQQRLKDTLKNWLIETFGVAITQQYDAAIQKQLLVGRVHARVGIPSWLIIRGVREIQRTAFALHEAAVCAKLSGVPSYFMQIIGFSTEVMCRSYEINTVKNEEVKHSYRLFSAMQDVAVQKDRQRGCLLDWENDLMYKAFSDQIQFHHTALSKSEFGLWFIHKAAYAFAGSEQVQEIIQRIYTVDQVNELIKNCDNRQQIWSHIQKIRDLNREIQILVDQLFQVAEYIESGNDTLTNLLTRRYLNTIVKREINFSRKNHVPLALLALDADFFKQINDQYGHAAGDLALQSISDVLQKNTKGSDYAFRVGGEEFLLLLVDTELQRASSIAEKIRAEIERTRVQTAQGAFLNFTVSIGCVDYDGHPDYQKLLDAADAALYIAKNSGRNQVHVSPQIIKSVQA
jgi:diguanylate cyclase